MASAVGSWIAVRARRCGSGMTSSMMPFFLLSLAVRLSATWPRRHGWFASLACFPEDCCAAFGC